MSHPLTISCSKVNTRSMIGKLQALRYNQCGALEQIYKDYLSLSQLVKIQQQQFNSNNNNSLKADNNSSPQLSQEEIEQIENSKNYMAEYKEQLRNEQNKLQDSINKDRDRKQYLTAQNSNLSEESNLKSINFQSDMRVIITDANKMSFDRMQINRNISSIEFNINSNMVLIQYEQQSTPQQYIQMISLNSKSNSLSTIPINFSISFPQNIQIISSNHNSVSNLNNNNNRLIAISYEEQSQVEIFSVNNKSEVNQLGLLKAHLEPISVIQVLSDTLFITASNKPLFKLWKVNNNNFTILRTFKTQSIPTASRALQFKLEKVQVQNEPQQQPKSQSDQNIQFSLGFKDGSVKIFELTKVSQQIEDDNYTLNQLYTSPLITTKNNNLKDHSISSIRIATSNVNANDSTFNIDSNLSQITIGATIQTDSESIFVIIPQKERVFNTLDCSNKKYSNSLNTKINNKYFSLTSEYLISGSNEGTIFIWHLKFLSHPLAFLSPYMTLKTILPSSNTAQIMMVQYDEIDDILTTADKEGNILQWKEFMHEIISKK